MRVEGLDRRANAGSRTTTRGPSAIETAAVASGEARRGHIALTGKIHGIELRRRAEERAERSGPDPAA